MKAKGILSMLALTLITFGTIAQRGDHAKKDWNPEKRVEAKVERFAESNEMTEAQKEALKKSLLAHHEEMKAQREAERERRKELWKENKAKKDQNVKAALNDAELLEAWMIFEKEEHAKRKEKMKKHHHKKGKRSMHRKEKSNDFPTR